MLKPDSFNSANRHAAAVQLEQKTAALRIAANDVSTVFDRFDYDDNKLRLVDAEPDDPNATPVSPVQIEAAQTAVNEFNAAIKAASEAGLTVFVAGDDNLYFEVTLSEDYDL